MEFPSDVAVHLRRMARRRVDCRKVPHEVEKAFPSHPRYFKFPRKQLKDGVTGWR